MSIQPLVTSRICTSADSWDMQLIPVVRKLSRQTNASVLFPERGRESTGEGVVEGAEQKGNRFSAHVHKGERQVTLQVFTL